MRCLRLQVADRCLVLSAVPPQDRLTASRPFLLAVLGQQRREFRRLAQPAPAGQRPVVALFRARAHQRLEGDQRVRQWPTADLVVAADVMARELTDQS